MSSELFLAAASTQAGSTDRIFFVLVALAGLIILFVTALVTIFAIRFRRGSRAKRGELPRIISREFELGWTAATLFVFLFLFWWAGSTQLSALVPPKSALEMHVVAKQWMWKTQHANGAREINELHVPIDTPVRLVMTSQDVIHSFFIPAFRLKKDVLPGRYTETWFTPTKLGAFHLFCAEYCGTNHSRMLGRIVVMTQSDYTRWLAAQPEGDDLARSGAALFVAAGCAGCHAPSSRVHAPRFAGIYGREAQLASGKRTVVDDAYIRNSILQPRRDIVAGYEPIMPSFAGILSDGDVMALTSYIRSLAAGATGRKGAAGTPNVLSGTPERSLAVSPGDVLPRDRSERAPQ